jgi:serine kinase of HPr protein (carbohydrate metabolism regulator)
VIVHAGLLALRLRGAWRGALVMGEAGSGKSDLVLRALGSGFRMAADDRTLVWRSGGMLYGRAPESIAGLIELRGVGILPEPAVPLAEIVLIVRCEPPGEIERLPDAELEELARVRIPLLRLAALEASAPAKLGRVLNRLGRDRGAA